jgi:hypothetical protein
LTPAPFSQSGVVHAFMANPFFPYQSRHTVEPGLEYGPWNSPESCQDTSLPLPMSCIVRP